MVLSRLLRRVLGLVIVVPRLAWRPWPRLNGVGDIEVGDVGVSGEGVSAGDGNCDGLVMTFSSAATTPFAGTGGLAVASGVAGCEPRMALPSSDSASYRSGGKRSFSMSDLRLVDGL